MNVDLIHLLPKSLHCTQTIGFQVSTQKKKQQLPFEIPVSLAADDKKQDGKECPTPPVNPDSQPDASCSPQRELTPFQRAMLNIDSP